MLLPSGNTKGGNITVPLTSCLTDLVKSVLQIKPKIVCCHTADSKSVKQEVNGTVILPPFSIPCFLPADLSEGRVLRERPQEPPRPDNQRDEAARRASQQNTLVSRLIKKPFSSSLNDRETK